MPKRIQQRRSKGWRMPDNATSVARPHKFGNPYRVGHEAPTADAAVLLYREWLDQPEQAALLDTVRRELQGLDLACWCPIGRPCHADVLLEVANR